ncbi:MAG: hypothetical protein EXR77_07125 [Myxococcales bacterium]|nr:hypothetical protein [Myxococcales bacterium]
MRRCRLDWVGWALTTAGLSCCAAPQVVIATDKSVLMAAQAAQERAGLEGQQQAKREAEERSLVRQTRFVAEFETVARQHQGLLGMLQKWDAAADSRIDPVALPLAAWPGLPALLPVVEACELRLNELANRPLHSKIPNEIAGRARLLCDLARRAKPIIQRQVLANARTFLAPPPWLRAIAQRYSQHGRLSWHQFLLLVQVEEHWDQEAGPYVAHGLAVSALLPRDEWLQPAWDARNRLVNEMANGARRFGLPASVAAPDVEMQVRRMWANHPAAPSDLQGLLLQVRALDADWQPLRDDNGRVKRHLRDAVAVIRVTAPPFAAGCWVNWLQLERRGRRIRLLRSDDVRMIRCPDHQAASSPQKT